MTPTGKMANDVSSAVHLLASAILNEPRWKAWSRAREAVFGDSELQRLFGRYRSLSGKLQQGENLDGQETLELADVTNRIKYHALHRKELSSLQAMIALLREVNEALSDQLGIDFAANASPPRGSCCG